MSEPLFHGEGCGGELYPVIYPTRLALEQRGDSYIAMKVIEVDLPETIHHCKKCHRAGVLAYPGRTSRIREGGIR